MASTSSSSGTVRVVANGAPVEVATGTTLLAWLESLGRDPRAVAVERNGEIVPRGCFGDIHLESGDRVEVVGFVQGG